MQTVAADVKTPDDVIVADGVLCVVLAQRPYVQSAKRDAVGMQVYTTK